MKTTALLIGLFVFSGPVMAETYQVRTDPSGAPMCFTASGEKAPLDRCQRFVRQLDPSGAPMCFTESGDKAPLDRCPSATIALDLLASR